MWDRKLGARFEVLYGLFDGFFITSLFVNQDSETNAIHGVIGVSSIIPDRMK